MTDRSFGILIELKDRFSQGMRAIHAPIENAKRDLKQLEQAGRELKWAEKYQEKLQRLQPSLVAARETQTRLAAEIAATENPTKKLTREYEKANQKLAALETKEREFAAALEQSSSSLRQHGIDTTDLAHARDQLAQRTDHARAKTLGLNSALKAIDVRATAQQFAGLSAHLLAMKTAMAALSATIVGAAPVLAQMATAGGMAFGTAMSTAKVAAMSKELQKFSENTQVSTQALQEWRLAGRFEGVAAEFGELGDMGAVFESLQGKMAGLGSKDGADFAKSLGKIGLSAKEIKALKPDEALLRIGDALGKSKLTQQQKITFLKDISDDAAKLLPLLEKSGKSFAEIRDYANAVGAIQSHEQLENMKKTNRELSFWKLGLEGVMTQLSAVGSNVVNTLGPNVRQLFVDAKAPIDAWSSEVSNALAQFKADVDDMGWVVAFQRQIQEAYPTLYGFVAGAGAFGRGYGQAFVVPMLDSLKAGYARIADAMGGGDGIESKGRALGELMRPMTAIIDEVTKAIAFLIENAKFLSDAFEVTPLSLFIDSLSYVRSALDFVGDGLKWLGQTLGLIDPNSTASGFTVFLSTLATLAASALASKLVLGALGAAFNVVSFAMGPLVTAFKAVKLVFSGLSLLASANPFVLAAVAIAGVAYLIYSNWEPISAFFSDLWVDIKAIFSGGISELSAMLTGDPLDITGMLETVTNALASFPNPLQNMAGMFVSFKSALNPSSADAAPAEEDANTDVSPKIAALDAMITAFHESGSAANAAQAGFSAFFAGVSPGLAALATGGLSAGALVDSFGELRTAADLVRAKFPLITRHLGVLTRGFQVARIAFAVFSMAIRANPIGLLITAIVAVGTLIYSNWGRIAPFVTGLFSRIKATFMAFRASLSGLSWGQVVVKIVTAFSRLPGKLLKMGIEAIGKLAIGIMTAMGIPEGRARAVVVSIVAALVNLPSKMMEMGKQAMQGLADGIINAGAKALDAAKQIASDIGGAVKGFFNINSPSRLMMGYGGNISEGLGLGITAQGKQAIANARALSDGVSKQLKPLQTNSVVSFADARQRLRPTPQQSAIQPRDSLVTSLTKHRQQLALSGETRQQVGGEIRVKIDAPAGMNTSAKVSKPAGSKVGLTANVGKVSW